jgi:Zn-dependent M28 family amino/carboxypeptidase
MPGQSHRGPLPPATADQQQLAARLKAHVTTLATDIGDRNVYRPQALQQSIDFLTKTMRDLGYDVRSQPFEARGVTVQNLEAELKGGDRADEILVVGAHYDSVRGCPAANDNGSGVAAVLEIARALKDAKSSRTIRFAFFVNEEPPFFQGEEMGSVVYAKACRARNEKIVGMLSLETIGYYSDAKGSQKYPAPFDQYFPDEGNFIAFVGNEASAEFVREFVGAFRAHAQFPSEGAAVPGHIMGIGFSDHWSFWQQDYPALMVTDTAMFRYSHYHRDTDTPDKIDYDRTARVVEGVTAAVKELAR